MKSALVMLVTLGLVSIPGLLLEMVKLRSRWAQQNEGWLTALTWTVTVMSVGAWTLL